MNELLKEYLAGVQSHGVSGFEHLNTLMVRDKLFEQNELLSPEESAVLQKADLHLLEKAPEFVSELNQITTLEYERERRNVSAEQWWWYLDVITCLPLSIPFPTESEFAEVVAA